MTTHRSRSCDGITRTRRAIAALALVGLFLMLFSPVARADDISNNLDANIDATLEVVSLTIGGTNGVVGYYLQPRNSDGDNGCNIEGSNEALVVSVNTSNASVATVAPSSLTFDSCGDTPTVTVTPVGAGSANITLSQASNNTGGTFNFAPAAFRVNVAPPANTPPTLSLPGTISAEATSAAGAAVSFTATASDTESGPLMPTCSMASGAMFPLGSTTVNCSVTDPGGLTATGSFTVTVVDTTPPALELSNTAREATGPTGKNVDLSPNASASDLVDGPVPVSCLPASGSLFPLGTTTVTCSVTDAAGNSATGTLEVTVRDTTGPTVRVPDDISAEATGPDGAVVAYSGQAAEDIVDGALTPTCAPPSGSTFPLGPTTVTCTAVDAAGNEGSSSFTITVSDTSAPVLALPSNITTEATGPAGATVEYDASASDLVDGSVAVSCSPASGTTFALGTTDVTCSAEDSAGNVATGGFTVTVVDTTAPELTLPSDITTEATGSDGATVSYSASASDVVDGTVDVTCDPTTGSTFPLGATTVACSATDAAGNEATGSFTVTVEDTTAPVIADMPGNITAEATSPSGAVATWEAPTATDIVDGAVSVACSPASGSTFALGTTTVTCTATDAAGNPTSEGFTATVEDTTPPALALPDDTTVEATGPNGAVVTYSASATDIVDGAIDPTCVPATGSTFPIGTTAVECTATDAAGNDAMGTFAVTVVDTTAPALTLPAAISTEATGPTGADISYVASANDLVDGPVDVSCDYASGATFPLGPTTVTCSATDAAGNLASGSFMITVVDTTAPALTLPANVAVDPDGAQGATVTYAASATDLVDGAVAVTCSPASGTVFSFGATTVTCTATDAAGNSASGTFTVNVNPLTLKGFYAPVNMGDNVVNTVRGGSTVPLKFEVFAGGVELADTSVVDKFVVTKFNCETNIAEDPVDFTTTGGTSLRYDAANGQFVQNWKTPTSKGCYRVTLTTDDGSTISADFKVK